MDIPLQKLIRRSRESESAATHLAFSRLIQQLRLRRPSLFCSFITCWLWLYTKHGVKRDTFDAIPEAEVPGRHLINSFRLIDITKGSKTLGADMVSRLCLERNYIALPVLKNKIHLRFARRAPIVGNDAVDSKSLHNIILRKRTFL